MTQPGSQFRPASEPIPLSLTAEGVAQAEIDLHRQDIERRFPPKISRPVGLRIERLAAQRAAWLRRAERHRPQHLDGGQWEACKIGFHERSVESGPRCVHCGTREAGLVGD